MKTMSSIAKWTVAATSVLSLMVACGKKDDGGGSVAENPCANTYNGTGTNGVQCINGNPIVQNTGVGNLLNNVQFTSWYMSGTISISAMNGGVDLANPAAYAVYSGPIGIHGTAQVLQQLCGAPAGNYTIVSNNQAGYYYSGVIQNLNLTLQGPTTIQLIGSWMTSQVYNPQGLAINASGNRIGMNVQVIVNGQPCGSLSTH